MPNVSVVMASFNHAPFVREAAESALRQEGVDLELLVTDDASVDGTADVLRSISDPRLHLEVFGHNQGACVAMNDAIRRARGDYIAVLNSDDYFLPGKLAKQAAYLDAHPAVGAVFARPQFVDERGRPFHNTQHAFAALFTVTNRSRQEWLRQFFHHGNCLCHPTLMIRRSCYDRVGLLDPLLMQLPDLDLWVRLCSAFEIHVLDEPLTAFRILDRERNTSAPSKERLARVAWETETVLGHYVDLSEADLRVVLAGETAPPAGLPGAVQLALAAIRLGKPGYAPFGMRVLRDHLRQHPGAMSNGDYFKLVGQTDPYGAEYYGREFQWVRRSPVFATLRRGLRWFRSRNLHR